MANSAALYNPKTCVKINPNVLINTLGDFWTYKCEGIKAVCGFERYFYYSRISNGCELFNEVLEEFETIKKGNETLVNC